MPEQLACRLRSAGATDVAAIAAVIEDGARAYRGVIPHECWHEPYMPRHELDNEIAAGVAFTLAVGADDVLGVMGLQPRGDVALIRHAYVRTRWQRRGIGQALLAHARELTRLPLLIGTWAAASWALAFYRRHGFEVVAAQEKDRLLARYWTVPAHQVAHSVVLVEVGNTVTATAQP